MTKLAGSALLLLTIAQQPVNSSIQAFHRAYGPKASLLVSSPVLAWEVWPSNGAKVTSATMLVNGDPVQAVYEENQRRLVYRPDRPLLAGPYRVQCKVVVDRSLTITKDWSFQVSTNAMPTLPDPSPLQDKALEASNAYRQQLGLPSMTQEARLNAASLAHANYLTKNRRTGHYEKEGEPGFTGVTPAERLEVYGYGGSSWECVTYNSGDVLNSVRDLFNAPYHRIPFLQPGAVPFGSGYAGKNLAIKFGDSGETGTSVSPGINQVNVPTRWDGNESPNPLRMHNGVNDVVGYPVVLSYFSPENTRVSLVRATLSAGGQAVDCFVNSPANDDHLENSVILIPKTPLKPNTTYVANLEITTGIARKQTIIRNWTFQTGLK